MEKMKWLITFESFKINLQDINIIERDKVGKYKIPSYDKVLICKYNNLEIARLEYTVFTKIPFTKEFIDKYNTEIYISYLETDEDYQKNGLANLLLKTLIEKSKSMNIDVITLKYDLFVENPEWLIKQYEKVGFKILRGNKMYLEIKKPL